MRALAAAAVFYIAFGKGRDTALFGLRFTEPCVDWDGAETGSCMDELRTQVLVLVLMSATVAQLSDSLLPFWQAARARAASARSRAAGAPAEPRAASQLRLAAAEPLYAQYNELLLEFATATLFATAFPLAPLVVIVNNYVDLRADAVKVLRLHERPRGRAVSGIGLWLPIIDGVGYAAVFTNLAILVFTAGTLDRYVDWPDSRKLLFLVALEHAVVLAKFLLGLLIPDVPNRVVNAVALRDFLARLWVEGERPAAAGADEPWAKAEREAAASAAARRFGFRLAQGDVGGYGEGGDTDSEPDDIEWAEAPVEASRQAAQPALQKAAALAAEEARILFAAVDDGFAPSPRTPTAPSSGDGGVPKARLSAAAATARASGVPWTPALALALRARRAGAPPSRRRRCTDALCVPCLVVLLGCVTLVSTVAFSVGHPQRLRRGVDHNLDICGSANAQREARAVEYALLAGAEGALRAPSRADRTNAPNLFFAVPQSHFGICVAKCPAPATPDDGFAAEALLCTGACAALAASERAAKLGTCCFPAYATTSNGGGYCVPGGDVTAGSLRAAYRQTIGSADGEEDPPWLPTDEGLDAVRAALAHAPPHRAFADGLGRIVSGSRVVVIATSTAASILVSAALALAFASAPARALGATLLCALCAFALASAAFALRALAPGSTDAGGVGSAEAEALAGARSRSAIVAWVVGAAGVALALGVAAAVGREARAAAVKSPEVAHQEPRLAEEEDEQPRRGRTARQAAQRRGESKLVARVRALAPEVGRALRATPALLLLAAASSVCACALGAWWLAVAVYLAGSDVLVLSEEGHPLPARYASLPQLLLPFHAALGLLLLAACSHAASMAASATVALRFFRAGPGGAHASRAAAEARIADKALARVAERAAPADGMRQSAVRRLPRAFDLEPVAGVPPASAVAAALFGAGRASGLGVSSCGVSGGLGSSIHSTWRSGSAGANGAEEADEPGADAMLGAAASARDATLVAIRDAASSATPPPSVAGALGICLSKHLGSLMMAAAVHAPLWPLRAWLALAAARCKGSRSRPEWLLALSPAAFAHVFALGLDLVPAARLLSAEQAEEEEIRAVRARRNGQSNGHDGGDGRRRPEQHERSPSREEIGCWRVTVAAQLCLTSYARTQPPPLACPAASTRWPPHGAPQRRPALLLIASARLPLNARLFPRPAPPLLFRQHEARLRPAQRRSHRPRPRFGGR